MLSLSSKLFLIHFYFHIHVVSEIRNTSLLHTFTFFKWIHFYFHPFQLKTRNARLSQRFSNVDTATWAPPPLILCEPRLLENPRNVRLNVEISVPEDAQEANPWHGTVGHSGIISVKFYFSSPSFLFWWFLEKDKSRFFVTDRSAPPLFTLFSLLSFNERSHVFDYDGHRFLF